MLKTFFDSTFDRPFYAAFELNYTNGIKHPDRTFFQHDLIYIVEGEWSICQEGERYDLKKDDVIILTAHSRHYGITPCPDHTKTMYIHTNAAPCERLNSTCEGEGLIGLAPLVHGGESKGRIKRDFERIISEFSLEREYKSLRLNTAFSTLLLDMYDVQSRQGTSDDNELLVKLCRIFNENPDRFYSNQELSEMFFLGERTFSKRFKSIAGTTVHQYQMAHKLQSIKSIMLAHPEIKLRELAVNHGFCDEFHLSKSFKKYFGISPYRFRQTVDISLNSENDNDTVI